MSTNVLPKNCMGTVKYLLNIISLLNLNELDMISQRHGNNVQ